MTLNGERNKDDHEEYRSPVEYVARPRFCQDLGHASASLLVANRERHNFAWRAEVCDNAMFSKDGEDSFVTGQLEVAMSHPKITNPDLPVGEIMNIWPRTVAVFLKYGMLCVGCQVAMFHTVSDACLEYDLDENGFLAELGAAAQLVG